MAVGPVGSIGPIRFGKEFELDMRTCVLRRSGRALKLERIPTEILFLLLERAGELVTREEIAERVWGKGVYLDTDNSINSAIRKIRMVLRDDPDEPRFVQTVVGRGYMFLASQVEGHLATPVEPLSPESLAGRRIGDYRILHLLGGGGMGVVYKAEDLTLGRQVAIKFLPRELAGNPSALERLKREARLASSLDHPHVCSIYQLGEHEGQPFIVMPLLEGQTLREWIAAEAGRPAASCVREIVRLAIQMSDALQFAHEKGVIHRDIKPANIFLTSRGEIKVLDFGVATLRAAQMAGPTLVGHAPANVTETSGSALSPGTPAYLSPEQITGETLDARSDLFSLGAVLYEMATAERAFRGDSPAEIEEEIVKAEPQPIRELRKDIPERFEEIVKRALEKDRERRYQSAAGLSSDLRTLEAELAGQKALPFAADLPPVLGGARRRYVIASIVIAVALVLGAIALLRDPAGPQPFRDFTITRITETGKADEAAISPDGKYVAHVNDDNGLKSMRLRNIATGSDTEILSPAPTRFKSLVFSPDGNYLYFRQMVSSVGSEWNVFRLPVLGGKPQPVASDVDSDIIFSPDGRHISYVRANDPDEGKYRILEANLDGSGETVLSVQAIKGYGHEGYPPFAAWSPDGKRIVYTFARMADEPGIMRVLDMDSKQLNVFQHFPDLQTSEVRWLPNRNWLMLVSAPKGQDRAFSQVSAFSLADRKLYPITRDTDSYSSLTLSADGQTAAAVQTNAVSVLDLLSLTQAKQEPIRSNLENVDSLDWDRDGNLIFSDGRKLWRADVKGGAPVELTSDASGEIVGLAECSSGYILVNWQYHAGTQGSTIWRLNADGSQPVKLSQGKFDMAPTCSPDGRWAYYLDSMQVLKRVPVQGGTPEVIPVQAPNVDRVMGAVAFSPDGKSLVALLDTVDPATQHSSPRVMLMDASGKGGSMRLIEPHPRIIAGSLHGGGVRFSPDGKSLVYAIKEKGVDNVWSQPLDGSPGHALTSFRSDLVAQFRFSPDARTLAIKQTHASSDIVVLRSAR